MLPRVLRMPLEALLPVLHLAQLVWPKALRALRALLAMRRRALLMRLRMQVPQLLAVWLRLAQGLPRQLVLRRAL
jgi:hypothetical protein